MTRKLLLVATLLIAACSPEEKAVEVPTDPVVVYASYPDSTYLPALFDAYTKETGTIVIVRNGDADAMVDDVISNEISPPADVLITPSVRGVYRAAEEGALRPIDADTVEGHVPHQLMDADRFWAALTYRGTAIVGDAAQAGLGVLAEPGYRERLCLSSASNPSNLAVLATLIQEYGNRPAELMVRGWVANLGREPFETEAKLLAAIKTGDCAVGIATVASAREHGLAAEKLTGFVDIEGVGVARHARNPEGAQHLVRWLLSDEIQERHAASTRSSAATSGFDGDRNVGIVAWYYDEAVKLAERARYY